MAKDRSKKGRRLRSAGRVTLKPCERRGDDEFCAPLNHITGPDIEYWTCSCGRRYSRNAHKQYLKENPDWRADEPTPA